MRRQLFAALGMLLVFTVITGLDYPLADHRRRPDRLRRQGRRLPHRA